ncbi:MAG: hypothetical protein ACR2LZ_09595, partial [Pyrinomonadaceae bacterium]
MIDLQPATFEEFEREAERGNVVPVVRTVLADLQTPVSAFLRVANDARYACLLESVEGGERVARFSFIGAEPELIVRGRGNQTLIERGEETQTLEGVRAIDFVRDYFKKRKLARRGGLAPMAGGAVGYLAYDAVRWFEPVLDVENATALRHDDAVFMFFRTVLAFDRVRQQMEITSVVFTDEAAGNRARLRELYDEALRETERIEKRLSSGLLPDTSSTPHAAPEKSSPLAPASNWSRKDFEGAVDAIKEHIAAGD